MGKDVYFQAFELAVYEAEYLIPNTQLKYYRVLPSKIVDIEHRSIMAAIQVGDIDSIEEYLKDHEPPNGKLFRQGYELPKVLIMDWLYEAVGNGDAKITALLLEQAMKANLPIAEKTKKFEREMWSSKEDKRESKIKRGSRYRNILECAVENKEENTEIIKLLAPHFAEQFKGAKGFELLKHASYDNKIILIEEFGINPSDYEDYLQKEKEENRRDIEVSWPSELYLKRLMCIIQAEDLDKLKQHTLTQKQLSCLLQLLFEKNAKPVNKDIMVHLAALKEDPTEGNPSVLRTLYDHRKDILVCAAKQWKKDINNLEMTSVIFSACCDKDMDSLSLLLELSAIGHFSTVKSMNNFFFVLKGQSTIQEDEIVIEKLLSSIKISSCAVRQAFIKQLSDLEAELITTPGINLKILEVIKHCKDEQSELLRHEQRLKVLQLSAAALVGFGCAKKSQGAHGMSAALVFSKPNHAPTSNKDNVPTVPRGRRGFCTMPMMRPVQVDPSMISAVMSAAIGI